MAKHCIDIDNSEVQRLSQELGLHKAVVAAKVALWQEANDEIGKRFPIASELGYIQSDGGIEFQEEQSSGYKERTVKNASADATIAIAVDFTTAGEKLTKSSVESQKKKYIDIKANTLEVTDEKVNKIVDSLNSIPGKQSDLFNNVKQGISLNIAGNGIYTMKGKYTQQEIDDYTYKLLKAVIDSPKLNVTITSLRTGGQTGFDEAGAKAGIKLNISTKILAPKGYTFRNVDSQDISNESQFKERFKELKSSKQSYSKVANTDLHQKSILQEIVNQYFSNKEVSDVLSNLQNLLQLIKGFRNTFTEAKRFNKALNKLGYSINKDYNGIIKNTEITDKFNKEYKATKDILGDGVDKVLNDVFLKQTIKTAIDLMKVSKKFFISETDIATKTREDITTLFKDSKKDNVEFQNNLRKNYLSFLTVSAYIKSVESSSDKLPKMEEFLLTPLEEIVNDPSKENSDLQNVFLQLVEYNYKNGIKNDFLSFIRPNNIDYVKKQVNKNTLYGYRLNSFTADTRKVKNPDNIARLISDYNQLYFAENDNILEEDPEVRRINSLKTKFAKDMFKFLVIKDGLMYQNTSFIKAIDPILFQGTSKALDEVQDLFNNEKATQKDFIDTFGKTKEELNLDFIMKFGLHQNNYFDLKSQQLIVLQSFNKWLETNKLSEEESKEVINDNEIDVETELVLEDKYPIFWDEKEGTLIVNEFARITKGNNDPKLRKENKKFILSDKVAVFKKVPTPFKINNEVKTYDKIGFPLTFYVTHKEKGKRTPLKLAVIQDTINVGGTWITFQMTPEGKVTQLSNSTKDLLKDTVYYGDLQTNTIYQIINDSVKLKTFDKNKTQLVEIAKALANQFKDGYVTGTKAKYNESLIFGSGEVSSFGNSIEDQEAMSLSEEKTKNVKLNMFNRKVKPKADDSSTKENLLKLLNEHSAISKYTMKDVEKYSVSDLEVIVNNQLMQSSKLTEAQIQDKIKDCFKIK